MAGVTGFMVLDEPTRGSMSVRKRPSSSKRWPTTAPRFRRHSDLPELLELSDVIHVMRDGRITGSLTREDATEQSVMTLAAGEAEAVA